MEYHMSASQGTLEAYNKHSDTQPIYGVGQGATNAPTKSTLMDNIITKAFNKKAIGCILVDPSGKIRI
eukprot:4571184-Ditylum_brightwellii.AAC.1